MRIIDITKELLSCPVYEGDPIPRKRRVSDVESGGYMLTELTLGSHSGTHVDAPCHFIEGGEDISQVKIEKCIGKCAVCTGITSAEVHINRGFDRIILKDTDVTADDARRFAGRISLLGTDGMSFGGEDAKTVHEILLGSGVVLLENLELIEVSEGEYYLVALPLKISGIDGSPVRAVLIKDE